ncbi:UNVERIFIED_CONTAM: hypothetical protein Sradi_6221300 [Sesamum radiatum]|uniref:Uncharacterized protein n=1 Tax=Sesamum radiatum TaxID=300843 RepID=A0AAW2KBF4_SESRA
MAANNRRTIKELNAPYPDQPPLCITFPDDNDDFELKSGLSICFLLFTFSQGRTTQAFERVPCVVLRMKPNGETDVQLNLRAFPFSLKDKTKDWLYYLPSGFTKTWANMKTTISIEILSSVKSHPPSEGNLRN